MARRIKGLSDREWVATAASKEEASPVLQGINAKEFERKGDPRPHRLEIAATNRHILFTADVDRGEMPVGIWHAKTNRKIEGNFPNYEQVIRRDKATFKIDVAEAIAMSKAAVAYAKSLGASPAAYPVNLGGARVNGEYLALALAGASMWNSTIDTFVSIDGSLSPIRLDMGHRTAVVMPVHQGGEAKFDATYTLEAIKPAKDKAVEPEAVTA